MAKLRKSRPSSASSTASTSSSSRIPVKTSNGSPIALRTTVRAAPTVSSGVSVQGELGAGGGSSDTASLRGVSASGSNASGHSRRPSSSSPIPGQGPSHSHAHSHYSPLIASSTASTADDAESILAEREPATTMHDEHEESALEQLRKRMEVDEEARREMAAKVVVGGPKKLKKQRRGARDKVSAIGQDGQETASVLSRAGGEEEEENDYAEGEEDDYGSFLLDEQEPASLAYDPSPPVHTTLLDSLPPPPAHAPSLSPPNQAPLLPLTPEIAPPLPPTTTGPFGVTPLDVALLIPRLSFALASTSAALIGKTTKSAVLLPFRVASHLPLIGRLVPFARSSSAGNDKDTEVVEAGLLRQTAELSLGLTLAGIMLTTAGVEWGWRTLTGTGKPKRKTVVRFEEDEPRYRHENGKAL